MPLKLGGRTFRRKSSAVEDAQQDRGGRGRTPSQVSAGDRRKAEKMLHVHAYLVLEYTPTSAEK